MRQLAAFSNPHFLVPGADAADEHRRRSGHPALWTGIGAAVIDEAP